MVAIVPPSGRLAWVVLFEIESGARLRSPTLSVSTTFTWE